MIEYSVCENKKLNNSVYVYSPAVNRQKLLSVNLTTNGVSLVPMVYSESVGGIGKWNHNSFKHGGKNEDFRSRLWESDFPLYDDLGAMNKKILLLCNL